MRGCIPVLLAFAAMVVTVVYGGLPGRFLPLERAIPLNNQSVELGYLTTEPGTVESCKVWLVALSLLSPRNLRSLLPRVPLFLIFSFVHSFIALCFKLSTRFCFFLNLPISGKHFQTAQLEEEEERKSI